MRQHEHLHLNMSYFDDDILNKSLTMASWKSGLEGCTFENGDKWNYGSVIYNENKNISFNDTLIIVID